MRHYVRWFVLLFALDLKHIQSTFDVILNSKAFISEYVNLVQGVMFNDW